MKDTMIGKPKHLSRTYAEQFQEHSVVAAYVHRPPIPSPVFDKLLELLVDTPQAVLDAGCGMGAVARSLAPLVDRVDAVDFSSAMIEAGRQLPNGDRPNVRWIEGRIETVPLDPPYALIVAAGSLHWMDWSHSKLSAMLYGVHLCRRKIEQIWEWQQERFT